MVSGLFWVKCALLRPVVVLVFLAAVVVAGSPDAAAARTAAGGSVAVGPGCSLASAVESVNAGAAIGGCAFAAQISNEIVLPPGVTAASTFPTILTNDTAFIGSSDGSSVIDGGGARAFFIGRDTSAPTVSFKDLTIQNGAATGGGEGSGGAGLGGAVFVYAGTVTFTNVTFASNSATGGAASYGYGGGGLEGDGGRFDQPPGDGLGGGGGDTQQAGGNFEGTGGGDAGTPSDPDGGDGGFGGGGGGASWSLAGGLGDGGDGGFGGGGGASAVLDLAQRGSLGAEPAADVIASLAQQDSTPGDGGFGGGGGAGTVGGNGGFGGGGGFALYTAEAGGAGGYGGGAGGDTYADNGGGAGFGGAVFVRSGTIVFDGDIVFSANTAAGGAGHSDGEHGLGSGGGLFVCTSAQDGECAGTAVACGGAIPTFTSNSAVDGDGSAGTSPQYFGNIGTAAGANAEICLPEITTSDTSIDVEENTASVILDVDATDNASAEGSGLTYSLTAGGTDNAAFSIDADSGELSFATPPDFEDPTDANTNNVYLARVTVTDSNGYTDTIDLTITVTDVDDEAPEAADDAITTAKGSSVTFNAINGSAGGADTDVDTDDSLLAVTGVSGFSEGGSATFSGQSITYSPASNFDGVETFNYVVSDGERTDTAVVTATVVPPVLIPTCEGEDATHVASPGAVTNGSSGDDVIVGTTGDDVINGLGGNDIICGFGGSDTLDGGDGDDRIFGGGDADILRGGDGDDYLRGQNGDDIVNGQDGDDRLFGNNGADVVNGGAGRDYVAGNRDADTVTGGDGNDTVNGGSHADVVRGGPGIDTVSGNGGHDNVAGGAGNDPLVSGGDGDDIVVGNIGNDIVRGNRGNDVVRGGEGNDKVFGFDGDDELAGGRGNDQLDGERGDDTCDGGPGTDSGARCESTTRIP